ncbi:MAG TPA: hypothetical protein VGO22_18545 [Pseudorhizobium sp.]|nr:hypothetical protein [Pseudorhizobium sp.]
MKTRDAGRDIVCALMQKFTVIKRRIITTTAEPGSGGFGSPGGAHNLISKYEDEL